MKKIMMILVLISWSLSLYAEDVSADFDRIQEQWKEYQKNIESLSKEEQAVFRVTGFEAPNLYGRFEMIRDFPKKLKTENYRYLQVPTRDGLKLDGWFFPVEKAKGTVLLLPWHGGDMSQIVKYLRFLLKEGYQILTFNTRYWNYREKPETFVGSIQNDMNDIEDFLGWIRNKTDIKTQALAVMGCSRGAYRSILAGARFKEFKAVIADCPPTSSELTDWSPEDFKERVRAMILEKTGVDVLSDDYTVEKQIALISPRPVLILQGKNDTLIPVQSAQNLEKAAKFPKKLVLLEKSGHCNAVNTKGDSEIYIKAVTNFLNQYVK